ncbi:hypothetical protein [Streptomyces venezuelae]|nr:hypothetical protein [Streptomyces venezuelae]
MTTGAARRLGLDLDLDLDFDFDFDRTTGRLARGYAIVPAGRA